MKHIIEAWTDKYKKSIDCSNPKGFSQKAHCAGRKKREDVNEKVYADSGLGKWFGSGGKGGAGGGGWDRYNTKGERIGKCGDGKPGEGKPKCLSKAKAQKLRSQGGKKAIANAVRRKKAKDPQVDRPGTGNKPINVSNRIKKSESVNTYIDRVRERRDKSSYTS